MQSAGLTNSPQIRFSQCGNFFGGFAGTAAASSWAWSKWKSHPAVVLVLDCMEREGLGSWSNHGQLPSPGAHGMKVNNRTLCWIAEFRAGGKP